MARPLSFAGRSAAGFTLLEVVVALAIALPALILMYRQGVLALTITQSATSYQEALSRARSRLAALQDAALVPGERSGDDGGAYRWRTRIAPIASTAPPREAPRDSLYAGGTTLFALAVEVSWPGPRGRERLVLETRRLGPAAAP